MFTVPRPVKVLLYGGFSLLLLIIVTGHTPDILPKRLATPVSRNSEGWVMILGICAYVDFVRPRRVSARRGMTWALVLGAVVLVAGLWLRVAPWSGSLVTLNEGVVAVGILIPYLQLRRPIGFPAGAVLPAIALVAAVASQPWRTLGALGPVTAFLTDMAEAVAALILIPLVVDVIDKGLLRDQAPRRMRNALAALVLAVIIAAVHVITPSHPTGWFLSTAYWVQRTNEAWMAAIVILLYYATRRRSRVEQVERVEALSRSV